MMWLVRLYVPADVGECEIDPVIDTLHDGQDQLSHSILQARKVSEGRWRG